MVEAVADRAAEEHEESFEAAEVDEDSLEVDEERLEVYEERLEVDEELVEDWDEGGNSLGAGFPVKLMAVGSTSSIRGSPLFTLSAWTVGRVTMLGTTLTWVSFPETLTGSAQNAWPAMIPLCQSQFLVSCSLSRKVMLPPAQAQLLFHHLRNTGMSLML